MQEALQIHDNKHAYIFLNNVAFDDLKALIEYMYKGEVNVSQEQLPRFLASAEALKIKGDIQFVCFLKYNLYLIFSFILGLSEKGEAPTENLEKFIPKIQTRSKINSGKSGKIVNRHTTTAPSSAARQIRQLLQQQPSSSSHSVTLQQTNQSQTNFQTQLSELIPNTEVTPEVNFVSVNSHGEEIDIDQNEENGFGTLSKVWSLNQVL
jgi:hypothetical protein